MLLLSKLNSIKLLTFNLLLTCTSGHFLSCETAWDFSQSSYISFMIQGFYEVHLLPLESGISLQEACSMIPKRQSLLFFFSRGRMGSLWILVGCSNKHKEKQSAIHQAPVLCSPHPDISSFSACPLCPTCCILSSDIFLKFITSLFLSLLSYF
jgi:hypothetical protein